MVFESIVTDLMNRFLGDFIENLDHKQLNIGIWGGKCIQFVSPNSFHFQNSFCIYVISSTVGMAIYMALIDFLPVKLSFTFAPFYRFFRKWQTYAAIVHLTHLICNV